MKIILASHNVHKISEITALLADLPLELISLSEIGAQEPEETGITFLENALLKARKACVDTGLPALSDDSGLVVPALNGAPGIYSARYADGTATGNISKLLIEMQNLKDEARQALFYCVMVFMRNPIDPMPIICEGIWRGEILKEPRGAQGFGYDPIFWDPSLKQSAAELAPAIKNKMSHRGQALLSLKKYLLESFKDM